MSSHFVHITHLTASLICPRPPSLFPTQDPYQTVSADAGVMLVNLPGLRETYEELRLFVLNNRRGLRFSSFGEGAVGALKQFYEANLRATPLSSHFAAQPLRDYDAAAFIVHFEVGGGLL